MIKCLLTPQFMKGKVMAKVAARMLSSAWGHFEEGDSIHSSGPKAVPRKVQEAWEADKLIIDVELPPEPEDDNFDEDLDDPDREFHDGVTLIPPVKKKK